MGGWLPVTGVPALASAIGERVRQGRGDRGWTLDEMADRSGVSRRMLVSIEQGAANPSIAILLRLSDALGVALPVLVDVARSPAPRVTRAGQQRALWTGPNGGRAELVAGTEPPDVVELWRWTLAPGEVHHSEAHSPGTRELLLVLAGQLRLHVGRHSELLEPGDSAAFSGDLPHSYTNPALAAADSGGSRGAQPCSRFALTVFQPHVGIGRAR